MQHQWAEPEEEPDLEGEYNRQLEYEKELQRQIMEREHINPVNILYHYKPKEDNGEEKREA